MVGQRFYDGEGGLASHVSVNSPNNVVFHPITEDLFIADTYNHVVRKVDKVSGVITTVAGTRGIKGYSGDGGLATQAQLNFHTGIAFSYDGESMYIADAANNRVRVVKDGIITTVAGNGDVIFSGDGGLATDTSLYLPRGMTALVTGELVIADTGHHRIRKVNSSATISTIAGTGMRTVQGESNLGDNGPATSATLFSPFGVVVNSNGEMFIADQDNFRVRKIDREGKITTIAGTGTSGPIDAQIGQVGGLAINSAGDVFMALSKNCIRKVRELSGDSQIITPVAGICGKGGYFGEKVAAITAQLNTPSGVAVNNSGEIIIADTYNHRIRKVTTDGMINTIAGNGVAGFSGASGIAIDTMLNNPTSVTVTENGEIIISDSGNYKIRKVDRNGIVTAIAGNRESGFGGDGESAPNASLQNAGKVIVTDDGDVLFTDTSNNRIRKVDTSGKIETIAGNGGTSFSGDGVPATDTALNQPVSVAFHNGEVYIADTGNHRIRKVLADGTIRTIAGTENSGYCGDGDLAINACINRPVSVLVNNVGEVFISDLSNHIVQKIGTNGRISTFAGTPEKSGYVGDGDLATNAKLSSPQGLAINSEGELFIADTDNNVIRKVDKKGIISTVVAELASPFDISIGPNGELFVAENRDNRITRFDNNGLKVTVAGTTAPGSSIIDFHLPEHAPLVFVSSVSILSDTELIVTDTYNHMIKKVDINTKVIAPLTFGSSLSYPRGAISVNDDVYFADYGNHCIRKIDSSGAMSDVVGICGSGGYSVDGSSAINANLFYPSSVAVASNGDMFIADSGNHIIRKVSVGGIITTVAGIPGKAKFSGNDALNTHLYEPTDLVIAPNGELYLSDHGNHCIRRIDCNSGIIRGVAGQCGKSGFDGDGGLATSALLSRPRGLSFTKAGDLLIADFGNSVIRKVDIKTGIIATVAGVGESVGFSGDGGSSISAKLTRPTGIAVSPSGEYYIADFGNHLIRVIKPHHTCHGISNKDSTNVCSGNGYCVAIDTCRCHSGYYGEYCSITNCFGVMSNETAVCFDHGNCTAPNTCDCFHGYAGIDCSLNTCFGVMHNETNVCSGHGQCTDSNRCNCDDGYSGSDCSSFSCYGILSTNDTVCSGNGQCVSLDHCTCNPNYENYICSDVKCSKDDCLAIIESQASDHLNCFVSTFKVQFSPEINILNITWILNQFEHDVETVTRANPTDDYAPNVAKMYDGDYTVSAKIFYEAPLGEVRLRTVSIERTANCSVCSLGPNNNCRFSIGFDNIIIENGTTVFIHRMTPFTIKFLDHDSLNNDRPIEKLEIHWIYPLTSFRTKSIGENIRIQESSSRRELRISPTDPIAGMNQNVTIDITCQYQLPSREWTSVSFKVYTIPSRDITPAGNGFEIQPSKGYTLTTPFSLQANGWNSANLVYSFSFHDPIDNVEIRLSQSNTSLITSTLPTGSIPDFILTMRLRVLDLVTGDYGLAEKKITVRPYYGEGLLTQRLEDVIEQGGHYREMIAIASQVSVASRGDIKLYYDDLTYVVNKMVNYTKSKTSIGQMEAVGIEQQMYVVDLITRNRLIVSEESKQASLDIVSLIIDNAAPTSTSPTISNDTVQNMANIISNIAEKGYKDQNVASTTLTTSEKLTAFVASDLFMDGPPRTVTSKNFQLTVSLMSSHLLANQSLSAGESGASSGKASSDAFDIPSQFDIGSSNEEAIVSSLIVFHENPYSPVSNNAPSKGEQVSSHIVDIKFKDVNGTVFPVADLNQPLMIYLDNSRAKRQGVCPEAKFKCQYWSESDNMWKSDGCHWIDSPTNGNHIVCACNHTTSFSAFVLEKGDSCVKYSGIKITGIVFNIIYLIICLPILIGLFITRNYQPVKSRFIAPFIGIAAIIVDSVIQGIIRNALSLAAEQSASDAFSYVIMLTANPLFVTSLFVFLWQQIRYLLLQNIYQMMSRENRAFRTKFMRLNRMLASKTIFTLVSVCVALCILAYFAILVGVAAHYNDSEQVKKRDSIVIVQAVSFALFLIILALGILVTLIIDLVYSVKRETTGKIGGDSSTIHHSEQVNVTRTKNIGIIRIHFVNDLLLFRAEACFIFAILLLIILLYSIGIATVVQQPRAKAPIMIVRTVIEILFMFCRIVALGGFVFIAGLRSLIIHHRTLSSYDKVASGSSLTPCNESESELKVLRILRHEIGYQLLVEYCKQEFSLENVLLWKELESIRTENLLMTVEQRKHTLKYLKEMYIDNNSARQLNISHKPRIHFLKVAKMEQPDAADAEEAFKKLYGACMLALSDTMTRFCSSEPYLNFKSTSEMLVELKEDFVHQL